MLLLVEVLWSSTTNPPGINCTHMMSTMDLEAINKSHNHLHSLYSYVQLLVSHSLTQCWRCEFVLFRPSREHHRRNRLLSRVLSELSSKSHQQASYCMRRSCLFQTRYHWKVSPLPSASGTSKWQSRSQLLRRIKWRQSLESGLPTQLLDPRQRRFLPAHHHQKMAFGIKKIHLWVSFLNYSLFPQKSYSWSAGSEFSA